MASITLRKSYINICWMFHNAYFNQVLSLPFFLPDMYDAWTLCTYAYNSVWMWEKETLTHLINGIERRFTHKEPFTIVLLWMILESNYSRNNYKLQYCLCSMRTHTHTHNTRKINYIQRWIDLNKKNRNYFSRVQMSLTLFMRDFMIQISVCWGFGAKVIIYFVAAEYKLSECWNKNTKTNK